MNAERLLKLADFLEKLPPERFDYRQWVGDDWKGAPDLSCGTTACAAGWATTIPEFREAGLHMMVRNGGDAMPAYQDERSWAALRMFFGLELRDVFYLFHPEDSGLAGSATAAEVASHIRAFVRERQKMAAWEEI